MDLVCGYVDILVDIARFGRFGPVRMVWKFAGLYLTECLGRLIWSMARD